MRKIRKNPALFAVFAVVFGILFSAAIFIIPQKAVKYILAALGAALEAFFAIRYFSLGYFADEKFLYSESGFFFKKTEKLPLEKILMKSSYSLGKTVFLTIIRTAGGAFYIFGKF